MTPMPRLWNNGTQTGRRINVLRQSLTLTDTPPCTAQLTLPPEENLNVLDYLELFSPFESAGIFRVASVSRDYNTGQQTVYCERAESVLGDTLVTGAITSFSGTISAALTKLLSYQHTQVWTVGTVQASANVYLDIGEKDILSNIVSMMGSAPDYYVEFDQSTTPWTVNILQKSEIVTSEGRLGRNIVACNIQFDTSDMCTRVINDKLPNGHIDSERISDYPSIFEQTIVLDQNASAAQNLLVAQSYMANRDRPVISIDITARNLYKATGVSIDNFKLRQLFRLALPDYGLTEQQRIIEMAWKDVYSAPESVALRLANRKPDLIIDIARANRSVGGGGRGGSSGKGMERMEGDYRTRISQTEQVIALTAQQLSTEMQAAITVQADRITNLVTWKETADQTISDHSASLILMANQIESKVSQTDYDSLEGRVDTAESTITQQAGVISTKVSAGDIASSLNQTAQSVQIQASKIDLSGYVTASELSATNAAITNLVNGITQATAILTDGLDVESSLIFANKSARWQSVTKTGYTSQTAVQFLGDAGLDLGHVHAITATVGTGANAGKIYLTLGNPSNTSGDNTTNFNIADTQFYQDGVSAAEARGASSVTLSGPSWGSSGGTSNSFTVSASNGDYKTQWCYLTRSSWNNGACDVHLRSGTATGTVRATNTVDIGSASNWQLNYTAQGEKVSVTIAGKTFSHTF